MTALLAASLFQPAAVAVDLNELRRRAQEVADEVSRLERARATLAARSKRLQRQIDRTSAEIGVLEAEIGDANEAVSIATERYIDRAVEAYKTGSVTRLALMLSADSLGELMTMAEATLTAGEIEGAAVEDLEAARSKVEAAQARLDGRKASLLAAQSKAQVLSTETNEAIASRRSALAELVEQIEDLEAQARRAAQVAAVAQNVDVGAELLKILQPAGPSRGIPAEFASTGVSFEGIASWYGPGFEGNPTASGQIFDSSLYTAASKELPLGTWLYVSFQGRGVVVLVNDRGPYVDDRILDLSRAAAQAIGITGLGWVEATILVKA